MCYLFAKCTIVLDLICIIFGELRRAKTFLKVNKNMYKHIFQTVV